MTQNSDEFITEYLKKKEEEEHQILLDTIAKGGTLEEVAERIHNNWGGARPGSGRKKGSGHGRVATERLQFDVTPEFRKLFEELADREDLSRVRFLQKILFAYRDQLRAKGEIE